MYLGRKALGQEVSFAVSTKGGDGVPLWPSAPPFIEIWKDTALVLAGLPMPKVDNAVIGLFRRNFFLDRRFSVGMYRSIIRWTVGGFTGVRIDHWEIIAGGDVDGSVISIVYHEMPFASFLVQQLDSGNLVRGKNPKV